MAGNVLSWIDLESKWLNLIKASELCIAAGSVHVHMPWCQGMSEAKMQCEKLRGRMTVIQSMELQRDLFSVFQSDLSCQARIWTGFSDEEAEGSFVDVNDGGNSSMMPFSPGQPNGDTEENCLYAKSVGNEIYWYDSMCWLERGSFCTFDQNPRVQIRGSEGRKCSLPFSQGDKTSFRFFGQ